MPSLKLITFASLCFGSTFSFSAFADCYWHSGPDAVQTTTFDVGNLYIPRDAPIGSVIGKKDTRISLPYNNGGLVCDKQGDVLKYTLERPTSADIDVASIRLKPGTLMKTNISGVGIIISNAYTDHTTFNYSVNHPYLPLTATTKRGFRLRKATYDFTLVKIGNNIAAGKNSFNQLLLSSMHANQKPIEQIYLNGSVTTSQCKLPSGTGTQIRVSMGTVEKRHFNGKGTTSESVTFDIPLNNCVSDPSPIPGQSWNYFTANQANIRFEGAKGSTILNAANGELGLNSDSTAKGVAVQILRSNGTAVKLGEDRPIGTFQNSITSMQLKARYIQTSDSPLGPEPGSANATANFTLTYK